MSQIYWANYILLGLLGAPASAEDSGQVLFNGKDLTGWVVEGPKVYKTKDGKTELNWKVEDGMLVCAGKGFGFLRYKEEKFADFAFHVEYKMAPNANSGIGIRTGPFDPKRSHDSRPSFFSYEVQLLDDANKPPNKHSSGSLYRYVAPSSNPVKPSPEWNAVDVECTGPRIKITINGKEVMDFDQSTDAELKKKPLEGFICLQSHTNPVTFRNIRIVNKKDSVSK